MFRTAGKSTMRFSLKGRGAHWAPFRCTYRGSDDIKTDFPRNSRRRGTFETLSFSGVGRAAPPGYKIYKESYFPEIATFSFKAGPLSFMTPQHVTESNSARRAAYLTMFEHVSLRDAS
ncbi:hypothetical protein EVAR_3089_1 [Eumeta japonica]|uniref:Uncharacterized protein n=1 Tax=Eumeta variegata TaxID=151549 RepID=A0A4C1SUL1_EUMVA|nr:hypothetical protein EVAR_3089_1 [Eumeta japonica]